MLPAGRPTARTTLLRKVGSSNGSDTMSTKHRTRRCGVTCGKRPAVTLRHLHLQVRCVEVRSGVAKCAPGREGGLATRRSVLRDVLKSHFLLPSFPQCHNPCWGTLRCWISKGCPPSGSWASRPEGRELTSFSVPNPVHSNSWLATNATSTPVDVVAASRSWERVRSSKRRRQPSPVVNVGTGMCLQAWTVTRERPSVNWDRATSQSTVDHRTLQQKNQACRSRQPTSNVYVSSVGASNQAAGAPFLPRFQLLKLPPRFQVNVSPLTLKLVLPSIG